MGEGEGNGEGTGNEGIGEGGEVPEDDSIAYEFKKEQEKTAQRGGGSHERRERRARQVAPRRSSGLGCGGVSWRSSHEMAGGGIPGPGEPGLVAQSHDV